LVKKITIRPKYAKKDGEGVIIGRLPSRPIEKGIAEASLLAHIIVSKMVDHLPFYRQIEIFKRDFQWEVNSSTINDWFVSCCTLIEPLYQMLEQQVLKSGYIQADESPIRVLDKDKEGSSHQGYMWVFHSPERKTVLFKYSKGRGDNLVKDLLRGFDGIVQCDGYAAYDKLPIVNPKIKLAGCLAHVRRKFYEAQTNDKQRSEDALTKIQNIYALERKAKEMDYEQRKQYRIEQVKPILEDLKTFAEKTALEITPKSQIGKAVGYLLNQMQKMVTIIEHGNIEMDNNLIENKIRPLALGRKNYMFAGSHDGAERLAIMYSFMATCKANGINPYEWLKKTLESLPDTKISDLEKNLPGKM
jgi:transposase